MKMNNHGRRKAQRGNHQRRQAKSNDDEEHPSLPTDKDACVVLQMFETFQQELDLRYDKYEQLVKLSRDVTIESKRIIFLLHRIMREENADETLDEAIQRLTELRERNIKAIAEELAHEDPHVHLRAFSPGLQEYIEAISFYHFLKNGSLLSLKKLQEDFTFSSNMLEPGMDSEEKNVDHVLTIPPSEYILGIADLTGELMRKCINSICTGNLNIPFTLRTFMREILEGFVSIGNNGPRELNSKVYVMRQSMDKVENACYMVKVRRTEIPDYKLSDVLLINRSVDDRDKEEEFSNDF